MSIHYISIYEILLPHPELLPNIALNNIPLHS